jgi:L-histidine Nalpha-methyltransferase
MSSGEAEPLVRPMSELMKRDVWRGFATTPKQLPPYLLYDEAGSRLYERITDLPEYYLTRAEREILATYADEIVHLAAGPDAHDLRVVELGAGSAVKTELILRAVLRRHGACRYVPVDVSRSAIEQATERMARDLPEVSIEPYVMPHTEAIRRLRRSYGRDLVLFIGSSVGNFEDEEAVDLLAGVREALGSHASLLLGTDLVKREDVLVRAYDDAAGVTAAFNKNVLERINREMGADFDTKKFRHVARWNQPRSRVEMHLESVVKQSFFIAALEMRVDFEASETIHTESSVKYDVARVRSLLDASGFELRKTFYDKERRFAVHIAA